MSVDPALRGLEELFGKLPVRDDRRDTIAMEAKTLYLVARCASTGDLPRSKRTGARIARRELADLAKLTFKLGKHIKNMHRDALEALEAHRGKAPDSLDLKDELIELLRASDHAQNTIPRTPVTKNLHAKNQARDVTKCAAYVFAQLTGKQVRRNPKAVRINADLYAKEDGEFYQFLTDVFKLLRIDAKASGQVKMLLAEKGRPKKSS